MKKIFLRIFLQIIIILTINSQLTVLNPYNLAEQFTNKQIDIKYGKIGLLNDFYVRGQLYMDNISEKKDACSPLNGINLRQKENSLYEESFKIILAYQGSCSFSQKARNAQNVGASMIIIINTENTPLNDIIFNEDSYDIKIPVAFINNNDGKIIDNFINSNPSLKVIVEVNFSPRSAKNFVDFRLFFSSSEPRAYLLLESMEKYIDNYGDQVHFIPYYTVHQNPYNTGYNLPFVSKTDPEQILYTNSVYYLSTVPSFYSTPPDQPLSNQSCWPLSDRNSKVSIHASLILSDQNLLKLQTTLFPKYKAQDTSDIQYNLLSLLPNRL